ncbi:MAG: tetratricopeptide repeat protein, partial [Candidatus Thorarchaeota archaeon]|nr:tetratricopeptide repeat protein [Candidatus Thorarchaeota archaeon]
KVEGLTKLEIEKLKPEIKEEARRIEETPTESKRQALPTFSSKKVVDVTEKYDEQKAAKETIVKDTPSVSRESESASSCFSSAAFHLRKGNWDEAEKAYVRGLALEPENSEAWIHLGSLLLKKNKFKEAENALRVATKHSSNNANAWYLLGVCLQKQENWNDALNVLRTAKNLNQAKADIWQALGESEFHMGQYQDAARSFLRTLRISPEHKDAMFYLALCMERRGNRQHALSLFIKLLNTGDLSASMLEKIAGAFERLNRPAEAREARRRAALARKIGS